MPTSIAPPNRVLRQVLQPRRREPPRKDSDRGPRGPIKERPVGRLYDADEDWRSADDPDPDNFATSAEAGAGAEKDDVESDGDE